MSDPERTVEPLELRRLSVIADGPNVERLVARTGSSEQEIRSWLSSEKKRLACARQDMMSKRDSRHGTRLNYGTFTPLESRRVFEGRLFLGDDWHAIARHVGSRTFRHCVNHACLLRQRFNKRRIKKNNTDTEALPLLSTSSSTPASSQQQPVQSFELNEDELLLLSDAFAGSELIFHPLRVKTIRDYGFQAADLELFDTEPCKSDTMPRKWSQQEEASLQAALVVFPPEDDRDNWRTIATYLDRSRSACMRRYQLIQSRPNTVENNWKLTAAELMRLAVATVQAFQTPLPLARPLYQARIVTEGLVELMFRAAYVDRFTRSDFDGFDAFCNQFQTDVRAGDVTHLSRSYSRALLSCEAFTRLQNSYELGHRLVKALGTPELVDRFTSGMLAELLAVTRQGNLERGSTCESALSVVGFVLDHYGARRGDGESPLCAVAASTLLHALEKRGAMGLGDAHSLLSRQVAQCARLALETAQSHVT